MRLVPSGKYLPWAPGESKMSEIENSDRIPHRLGSIWEPEGGLLDEAEEIR